MTSIHPPRVATWLLRRFSAGPHGEAIAGDLLEQYQSIRSPLWYWRQVLSAAIADMAGSVVRHKARTAGALVGGWIVYFALSFPATAVVTSLRRPTLHWLGGISAEAYSKYGGPEPTMRLMLQIESSLVVYVACVITGWIVAKLTRSSASVAAFALSVLVFEYGMIAILSTTQPWPAGATFPIEVLFLVAGRPLSVLVGGLLAIKEPRRSPAVT
jgi:hypothetical protein